MIGPDEKASDVQDDDYKKQIEARLAALEALGKHCSNEEDREIDNFVRKVVRGYFATRWFLGGTTKIARDLAPIFVVVYLVFSDGSDAIIKWLASWLPSK